MEKRCTFLVAAVGAGPWPLAAMSLLCIACMWGVIGSFLRLPANNEKMILHNTRPSYPAYLDFGDSYWQRRLCQWPTGGAAPGQPWNASWDQHPAIAAGDPSPEGIDSSPSEEIATRTSFLRRNPRRCDLSHRRREGNRTARRTQWLPTPINRMHYFKLHNKYYQSTQISMALS